MTIDWTTDAAIVLAGVGYVGGVWLFCRFDAYRNEKRRRAERKANAARRAAQIASWHCEL
jgi:hypothetical protein